jgi:proline dehydrogenase
VALARRALLWASTNPWIAERAVRTAFVRRSVSAFMPGETSADAVAAARRLASEDIGTILTELGENVTTLDAAALVRDRYLALIDDLAQAGLDAHLSVKVTQLGYDLDPRVCETHLVTLVDAAIRAGIFFWLDMERSSYVDGTLALYRTLRERTPRVGVALQAYLYRTPRDVEALMPLGAAIRLVKGAYLEPASVAYPKKADVDEQYFTLASRLLSADAERPGALLHVATHDVALQDRLRQVMAERRVGRARYSFAMLYGIRAARQRELAGQGEPLRCLISYGSQWFPWYMRRLAERPANVWFVVRNLVR